MMFPSFRGRVPRVRKGRSRSEARRRAFAREDLETRALLSGTVAAVASASPNFSNTMMLETDGTVLMQGSNVSKNWYRLTPSASGSYTAGTWSQVASMGLQRLYFGSNVLQDGRVLVQGGEYSGPTGASNITNTGEIYNPVTNSWANIATFPQGSFGDDPTTLLPDGRVLAGYIFGPQTYLYDPTTNVWTTGGTKLNNDRSDEETWIKLPDDSVLSYDVFSSTASVQHAQRYLPSLNQWFDAGNPGVSLSDSSVGFELGPGFNLPDGRAFILGANGKTAFYTPPAPSSTAPGSWTVGPVLPGGLAPDDAPGAILPNGKILFTADTPLFHGPSHLFEFDPTTNVFTDVTSLLPTNYLSGPSYVDRMLVLPTGQVLLNNGGSQLQVYTPDLSPVPSSTPTIGGIVGNGDGSYTLTGTGLNGISEGASYGDDAEMSSNYPIVRFTDSSNRVFYARTFGWTGQIAQGATVQTTKFTLPIGLPAGTYSVVVAANGSPSSGFSFTTPTNGADPAPTIATAASATPNPDGGITTTLSVLGADTLGESSLTYTWTTTAVPSGAASPSFSTNGTNAAKNDVATFTRAGSYTFRATATNLAGLSTSSTVVVTVTQTLTTIAVSPSSVNVAPGGTQQLTASGLDQFGLALASQPGFTWTLTAGAGSVSASGFYTAPGTGTLAVVTASSGAVSAPISIYVLTPPIVSQDVGSPQLGGYAGDDGAGHYTVIGAGTDIYGTSDQFRYAYTTLTGDGTLIARVVTEPNTNASAKAGVMFRTDLTAGSANVFMAITPGAGATFQARASANASTSNVNTAGKVAPYWVRLVRSGNTFTGSYSPDGITWTVEGSSTVALGTTVDVGLAVTSHDAANTNKSTFDHVNLNTTPTVAVSASATPNPDGGTTTNLSVLGADLAGESNLTYTWATTAKPIGAALPTFSTNGTNAARNDVATFTQAGAYTFTVTITNFAGLSKTSSVAVTVNQTLTSLSLSPASPSVPQGGTQPFAASAFDQFGNALTSPPAYTFSVVAGGAGGTISSTGLYTAPNATFGTDQVKVTSGSVSALAAVTVTQVQATIGTLAVAWGTSGTATLSTDLDGLRLLPGGRSTDLPWLNLNSLTITLSRAKPLVAADVSVSGLIGVNYGPVVVNGSGSSYTITLARPIASADRVTLTIANAGITSYTRRLDVLPGDVNDDGFVTSADVSLALANANTFFTFADLDGDGVVSATDAKNIRKLNGTSLPKPS